MDEEVDETANQTAAEVEFEMVVHFAEALGNVEADLYRTDALRWGCSTPLKPFLFLDLLLLRNRDHLPLFHRRRLPPYVKASTTEERLFNCIRGHPINGVPLFQR